MLSDVGDVFKRIAHISLRWSAMKLFTRHCAECGEAFQSARADKEFCCAPCRQAFNNRRMQRGAELYDLFRIMRRERGIAKEQGVWAEMCRLERQWNDEDHGRKTWQSAKKALANLKGKGSIPIGVVVARNITGKVRRVG